jgi:hypothetical protein
MRTTALVLTLAMSSAFAFACGSARESGFDNELKGAGGPGGGNGAGDGTGFGSGDGTGTGTASKPCVPSAANFDVPGNGCDDDGDGKVDNAPACDSALDFSGDAEQFAKAIGVCTKAADKGYGLVSAKFTRGYERNDAPQAEQHGILQKFGSVIKPREGTSLAVLSTGFAREFDGTSGKEPFGGMTSKPGFPLPTTTFHGKDWYNFGLGNDGTKKGNGTAPPGYPKAAQGCKQFNEVNDVIVAKLEIKAPPNVSGIKFDFNFYSGEWPAYLCSEFNDGFIAVLHSKAFNGGKAENMSFDKDNNPVSVNNGFFDRCTPSMQTGCAPEAEKKGMSTCPGGTNELAGTGFGLEGEWCGSYQGGAKTKSVNGGSTGWLTSAAPIEPGETFTIEFYIWDTGDAFLDSSVLIDNFTYADGNVVTGTDRPPK